MVFLKNKDRFYAANSGLVLMGIAVSFKLIYLDESIATYDYGNKKQKIQGSRPGFSSITSAISAVDTILTPFAIH